jgi:hypothetical protein
VAFDIARAYERAAGPEVIAVQRGPVRVLGGEESRR